MDPVIADQFEQTPDMIGVTGITAWVIFNDDDSVNEVYCSLSATQCRDLGMTKGESRKFLMFPIPQELEK